MAAFVCGILGVVLVLGGEWTARLGRAVSLRRLLTAVGSGFLLLCILLFLSLLGQA